MVGSLLDLFPQKSRRYKVFAMNSALNNSTSVSTKVQPQLEGVTFALGEICEARLDASEDWSQAVFLGFAEVLGVRMATMNFSNIVRTTPIRNVNISADTIRASKKRERKVKYDLYEQENDLREMIGLKKMKADAKKNAASDFESPEPKQKYAPVPRALKAGMIPIEEVRIAEAKCALSLVEHADYLKPFISPKVYNRLTAGPESALLVPIVSADNLAGITAPVVSDLVLRDFKFSAPLTAPAPVSKPVTPTTPLNDTPALIKVPTLIKATLRDYQVRGVSWLVDRYDRCINCILADEMGLGKTLQTITFFAYLKEMRQEGGPHLVVVPLSVMFNWITELKKFCPSLRVLRAHSNQNAECKILREKLQDVTNYDVVVTSYEMLKGSMEHSFHLMVWRSVTLDEGHRIKNMLTLLSKACVKLRARFKIILTGTPVQNNLSETYALLYYMLPTIFDMECAENFATSFSLDNNTNSGVGKGNGRRKSVTPTITDAENTTTSISNTTNNTTNTANTTSNTNNTNTTNSTTTTTTTTALSKVQIDRKALDAAHYMMRPFVLRRVKTEVEEKLPSKLETLIRCPLSDMQRFWIKALLMRESSAIMGLQGQSEEGEGGGEGEGKAADWKKLQSLLAQLRKAANHPYLLTPARAAEEVTEEIVVASGKMVILDRLLRKLHEKGHRVVIFSQFTKALDIIGDFLDLRRYAHCRLDGSTHRVMREVLINQFNKPRSPYSVFCLSTRAGGEGVNLFTADTVVLFDSDWNPQVDIQAMARVHRIGQTKPVHIYRLVSQGTVEERIVQRAQKKLFLDCMVNRGSTAQGQEIDRRLQEARAARAAQHLLATSSEEDNYWPSEGGSDQGVQGVRKEVKKEGAQSAVVERDSPLNTTNTNTAVKTEDDDLDHEDTFNPIPGPTTSTSTSTLKPAPASEDPNGEETLDASTVMSALKFGWNACFGASGDAHSISDAALDAIIDRTRTCDSAVNALISSDSKPTTGSTTTTTTGASNKTRGAVKAEVPSAQSLGLQEGQQSSVTQFEEAAPLVSLRNFEGEMIVKTKTKPSLSEISAQWITSSARARQSRLEQTHVVNVGMVSVLKANNYTLEEGESSIFAKEAARHKDWAFNAKKKGERFEHQDYCQYCWNYGSLICCAYCPASYHTQCVGLKGVPTYVWSCPHHDGCITCSRKGSAAGFLFRCEMCPNSYCEDCLPAEHEFVGVCERWAELGFNTPTSSCYIHCSKGCADFAKVQDHHSPAGALSPKGANKKAKKTK